MRVSTTKFQNSFGKYLKQVMLGDEVIVTKNGKSVAKLIKNEDIIKDGVVGYGIHYTTYEEYLEVTEKTNARYELIEGELILLSSPTHAHQVAVRDILVQFSIALKDSKCSPQVAPYDVKLYNDSPSFEEDPHVVQPDIFIMCDPENIDHEGRYQGKPALIVEVLSKTTRTKDMIQKLNLYMKSGVEEYWIVDPDCKNILVYQLCNKNIECVYMYRYGDVVQSVLFPEIKVDTNKM